VTVLLVLAFVPPPGLWEITSPSWFALLTSLVCWITLNPAAVRVPLAAPAVSPCTPGTEAVVGAVAITSLTVDPGAAVVLPSGVWVITVPGVSDFDVWEDVVTLKPSFCNVLVALDCVCPRTSGTDACAFPEEMNSVTGDPTGSGVPAPGSVRVASPAGTVLEDSVSKRTFRFWALIARTAAARVRPTTEGTTMFPSPWETVSVTVVPESALVPGWGSWWNTIPGVCVLASSRMLTEKPAFWTCAVALLTLSLITAGTTSLVGRVSRYAATPAPASSSAASSAHSHGLGPRRRSSTGGEMKLPVPLPVGWWEPVGNASGTPPAATGSGSGPVP